MSLSNTLLPGFVQRNFLVKVLLGVATIVLLTGLVGGVFYLDVSSDLNDQATQQVEATTVQHGEATENWLDDMSDNIRTLTGELVTGEGRFGELDAETLNTRLGLEENKYDDIRHIHYVDDETGEIIGSSARTNPDENLYEDAGFEQSDLSGQTFVLPKPFQSFDNEEVMTMGTDNLLTEDGVIIVEITNDGGPPYRHGYDGAETGIVTANDRTLFGSDPAIETPDDLGDGLTRRESGSDLYAYQSVEGYDNLFVVTETPKSSAFELRSNVLFNFGLTLAFALVILLGVTVLGGRSALSDLNTLAKRAETMGEGDLDVDLETSRSDEIGVLYDTFDQMRTDLKTRIREAEEARDEAQNARQEAEVARQEAEQMADYLREKADEYSEIMQEVSMGDMTRRMDSDQRVESMDDIANEFNDMITELEKTTGQLKSYVDEVEEAGAEVERSADTVREASEQVADSIQKISDDAYNQKERLKDVSETMNQITADLESLATEDDVEIDQSLENIRQISADISDIADLSEDTMAEAEHVAGAAQEQAAELNEVSERASDLQRYAKPLRDILDRFETEAEHEFVFSVGPTGGSQSPGSDDE